MKIPQEHLDMFIKDMSKRIVSEYQSDKLLPEYVESSMREVIEIYENMKKKLKPHEAAYNLMKHTDDVIERCKKTSSGWGGVQCKSKCSNCCKMAVAITHDEALLLKEVMRGKIPFNKLKVQSRFSHHNWHLLRGDNINCIFLKNDECMVYEYRPHACRAHFQTGGSDFCDIRKYQGIGAIVWRPVEIQIISSAVTIIGDADYMPVKLLEVFSR